MSAMSAWYRQSTPADIRRLRVWGGTSYGKADRLGIVCVCVSSLASVVCLVFLRPSVSLSWVSLAGCAQVLCVPLWDACLGWGFCHSALTWHVFKRRLHMGRQIDGYNECM